MGINLPIIPYKQTHCNESIMLSWIFGSCYHNYRGLYQYDNVGSAYMYVSESTWFDHKTMLTLKTYFIYLFQTRFFRYVSFTSLFGGEGVCVHVCVIICTKHRHRHMRRRSCMRRRREGVGGAEGGGVGGWHSICNKLCPLRILIQA